MWVNFPKITNINVKGYILFWRYVDNIHSFWMYQSRPQCVKTNVFSFAVLENSSYCYTSYLIKSFLLLAVVTNSTYLNSLLPASIKTTAVTIMYHVELEIPDNIITV